MLLVAMLLAATLVGCRRAAPTAPSSSGVWGFAVAGPTCPVEILGADCAPRPLADVEVLALDADGYVVAHTVTDAMGYYFLPLAPGSYEIEPQPKTGIFGTPASVDVLVVEGPPQELDLEYDTGMG
jgi:hypothetical protein